MLDYLISPIAPMFGRKVLESAADFYGTLATPAKNVATMFGYRPEGHTPPAPMFTTNSPEYRWNLEMAKGFAGEGDWKAATDYGGRVMAARDQEKRNVQDAALGFAGSVTPVRGIRAYHGSPHDFDKFSMSKIGTGEGAQAYGHGLYFAGNESVAKSYRDALSPKPEPSWFSREGRYVPADGASYWGSQRIASHLRNEMPYGSEKSLGYQDILNALEKERARVSDIKGSMRPKLEAELASVEKWVKANPGLEFSRNPATGRMYEVNIAARPEQFLDWDKPLAAQSKEVQRNLSGAYGNATTALPDTVSQGRNGRWYTMRGEDVVGKFDGWPDKGTAQEALKIIRQQAIPEYTVGDWYKKMNSPAFQSERLRDAGIPGIRYLDQGSRGAGTGSSNYVLFRDDIIDIIRKYGFVPPMFGRRPEDK